MFAMVKISSLPLSLRIQSLFHVLRRSAYLVLALNFLMVLWVGLLVPAVKAEDVVTTHQFNLDSEFVAPVPLRRPYPRYPKLAIQRNESGFVEVSFMVDAQGKTFEAVVKRSSDPIFEGNALRAVRLFKFEPARLGGESRVGRATATVIFLTSSQEGRIEYREKQDLQSQLDRVLLAQNAQSELSDQIEEGLNKRSLTACGRAFTYYVMQQYAQKFSDIDTELKALEGLQVYTRYGTVNLKDKRISACFDQDLESLLFERLLAILVNQNQVGEAYRKIQELDNAYRHDLADKWLDPILQKGLTQKQLARHYVLSDRGYQLLELMSGEFTLSWNGKHPMEIKLRCDAGFIKQAVSSGATIEIPDNFGQCQFEINGPAGAAFELTELASSPNSVH